MIWSVLLQRRAKWYFYAHGRKLNPEDGSLITSDQLRATAERLEAALKAKAEGTFKPYREKDELSYSLGTPEHTGRVRGLGVVPWKHGFSEDLDTYRSQRRSKAEQAEQMRTLEERIAATDQKLAMLTQGQDIVLVSPTPQQKSSVASTENQGEWYSVDKITTRTPCELVTPVGKKTKVVAQAIAKVPIQGGLIHGVEIPAGYARVQVDRVEPG